MRARRAATSSSRSRSGRRRWRRWRRRRRPRRRRRRRSARRGWPSSGRPSCPTSPSRTCGRTRCRAVAQPAPPPAAPTPQPAAPAAAPPRRAAMRGRARRGRRRARRRMPTSSVRSPATHGGSNPGPSCAHLQHMACSPHALVLLLVLLRSLPAGALPSGEAAQWDGRHHLCGLEPDPQE